MNDSGPIDPVAATPIILASLFHRGPGVWGMTSRNCRLVPANVRGADGPALGDDAVEFKRRGQYYDSLNIYLVLITESLNQLGYVGVATMRGLYKTLISMNDYLDAWSIACTVYSDMQRNPGADYEYCTLFKSDFEVMCALAIDVVDRGRMDNLELYTSETSGSRYYRFAKTQREIMAQFRTIRDDMRKNLGV